MQFHGWTRNDRHIAFYLVEEVSEGTRRLGLVRKTSLDDNILASFAERYRHGSAAQIGNGISIKTVGHRTGKPNLMVVLLHRQLVDRIPTSQRMQPLQVFPIVEIGNISDHKMPAIDRDGVALLH